jgi:hypothetical protein
MAHSTVPASATAESPSPPAVAAALELPALDGLTDDQVRGADCVWCKTRLTAETAVDLGEHMSPLSGTTSPMRWFPRACSADTAKRAHAALAAHAPECEQCADDPGRCDTGRWLHRLVRENRR